MVFRRRKKADPEQEAATAGSGDDLDGATEDGEDSSDLEVPSAESAGADDADGMASGRGDGRGPWDVEHAPDDDIERVDLGGVLVPIVAGMELRAEVADERIVAATLIVGKSALQIQPFAAPRTMGIWDEVRGEIAGGIIEQGGEVREDEGVFGTELRATVPVRLPDGADGVQQARFLGVDGPRWFLRAVLTGEAAGEPAGAAQLEDVLAGVVVVRGVDPMAPREPIELTLPPDSERAGPGESFDSGPAQDPDAESTRTGDQGGRREDDLKPFERGPEITETR